MNRHGARILIAAVLVVAVGTMGVAQYTKADFGKTNVWMNITNMKTNTVKTLKWEASGFQFESNVPVAVDSLKEKKIKQIFGTNEFKFTWVL